MPLLNWFWPYSYSWHVTVNSNVYHTIYSMAAHSMGVHDIGLHDVGMHSVGVYGINVPGVGAHKTLNFVSGKKVIFDAYF